MTDSYSRRKLLSVGGLAIGTGLAGCTDILRNDSGPSQPNSTPVTPQTDATPQQTTQATESAAQTTTERLDGVTATGWPSTTVTYEVYLNQAGIQGAGGENASFQEKLKRLVWTPVSVEGNEIPESLRRFGMLSVFSNQTFPLVIEEFQTVAGASARLDALSQSLPDAGHQRIQGKGEWLIFHASDSLQWPFARNGESIRSTVRFGQSGTVVVCQQSANCLFWASLPSNKYSEPKRAAIEQIREESGAEFGQGGTAGINPVLVRLADHYRETVAYSQVSVEPEGHTRFKRGMDSVSKSYCAKLAEEAFDFEIEGEEEIRKMTEFPGQNYPSSRDLKLDQFVGYSIPGSLTTPPLRTTNWYGDVGRDEIFYFACDSAETVKQFLLESFAPSSPRWTFRGKQSNMYFLRGGTGDGFQYVDYVVSGKESHRPTFGGIGRLVASTNVIIDVRYEVGACRYLGAYCE